MGDTNYFSGIVKIVESPWQTHLKNNNILLTYTIAEITQIRQSKIVRLVFWGNVGDKFKNYYNIGDYILIEGYLSVSRTIKNEFLKKNKKKIIITCLKVYPIRLNSKNLI